MLRRYLLAQADPRLPSEGLTVPFDYLLRQIALDWHVAPPDMRGRFSFEDIERELEYRQITAEAQAAGRRR